MRPCQKPDCLGDINPLRRSTTRYCDRCRIAHRGAKHITDPSLRRGPNGSGMPILSSCSPRVFEFDAIRRWFPVNTHKVHGGPDKGWIAYVAAALTAAYPAMAYSAARQRVMRLQRSMVDAYVADSVACALGVHPSEIWPDWHDAADIDWELASA